MIDRLVIIGICIRLFCWIRLALPAMYWFLDFTILVFEWSFSIIGWYVAADCSVWIFIDDHDRNSILRFWSFPAHESTLLFSLCCVRINESIHLNYLQLIFSLLIIDRYSLLGISSHPYSAVIAIMSPSAFFIDGISIIQGVRRSHSVFNYTDWWVSRSWLRILWGVIIWCDWWWVNRPHFNRREYFWIFRR